LRPLIDVFLDTEIEGGLDPGWKAAIAANGIISGRGIRQGMPISPLYAGVYLRGIDKYLIQSGVMAARYVDDIACFFSSEVEAIAFHRLIKAKLSDLGLTIGDPGDAGSKTVIYKPYEPAEFLEMELARSLTGTYRLRVGKKVVDKIVQRITDARTPGALLERGVSLTNMNTYFLGLQSGFLNAYGAAENKDELEVAMSKASRRAQQNVLNEVFGATQLAALGSTERRFIGVDLES
jgi:hypothetical protein